MKLICLEVGLYWRVKSTEILTRWGHECFIKLYRAPNDWRSSTLCSFFIQYVEIPNSQKILKIFIYHEIEREEVDAVCTVWKIRTKSLTVKICGQIWIKEDVDQLKGVAKQSCHTASSLP